MIIRNIFANLLLLYSQTLSSFNLYTDLAFHLQYCSISRWRRRRRRWQYESYALTTRICTLFTASRPHGTGNGLRIQFTHSRRNLIIYNMASRLLWFEVIFFCLHQPTVLPFLTRDPYSIKAMKPRGAVLDWILYELLQWDGHFNTECSYIHEKIQAQRQRAHSPSY